MLGAMLLVATGFASLGVWQVHRLGWKRDLIASIDTRIHAALVDAPGQNDRPVSGLNVVDLPNDHLV